MNINFMESISISNLKNVLRANQTVQLLLFLYFLIMINEMDHTDNLIDTICFSP